MCVSVRRHGDGYAVSTTAGHWVSPRPSWSRPAVLRPAVRAAVRDGRASRGRPAHAGRYRNPGAVPDGGVLVVGASATGVQLADELAAAGRDVVLAVGPPQPDAAAVPRHGHHVVARRHGCARTGALEDHPRPAAARREPSLQLVGSPSGRDVDLPRCRSAASASPAGWTTSTGATCGSPTISRPPPARPTATLRAAAAPDRRVRRQGRARGRDRPTAGRCSPPAPAVTPPG